MSVWIAMIIVTVSHGAATFQVETKSAAQCQEVVANVKKNMNYYFATALCQEVKR